MGFGVRSEFIVAAADVLDECVSGADHVCGAETVSLGHAFVQNVRRGHYELGVELEPQLRVSAAFAELALAV
ncbi:hypothetical protein FDG2_3314 [Candidatus Protofrankia californiensis]|uniref:Uncharacterized protein n=1 Tax=Candidatus Protofrankia californiensis TaxID=1839754 RepID=A0A1C3NZD1_9ACTN|nr:hypothetical protein FDG2_3314 [Candidatus Protofrankia californiensis]